MNMNIFIDNLLRVQEGATSKVLRHMSHHHLGMPRIVIDTHHLKIVVNHYHLMIIIDQSHLMIIIDKSHHMPVIDKEPPMIFDDTPHDMLMMQEDDHLDMKRPRLLQSTTPIIWCIPSLAPPPKWHLQDRHHMRRIPMVCNMKLHQETSWWQVPR